MKKKLSLLDYLVHLGPFQRMAILFGVIVSVYLGRHLDSVIIKELITNPSMMADIFPLSKKASRVMMRPLTDLSLKRKLSKSSKPIHVLQYGIDLGYMSMNIMEEMKKYPEVSYVLDINGEADPKYINMFLMRKPNNVKLKWGSDGPYDIIICITPEQLHSSDENHHIISQLTQRLSPKGVLSRARYVLRKKWLRMFFEKNVVDDVMATDHIQRDLTSRNLTKKYLVWDNLPPVYVYHTTM